MFKITCTESNQVLCTFKSLMILRPNPAFSIILCDQAIFCTKQGNLQQILEKTQLKLQKV